MHQNPQVESQANSPQQAVWGSEGGEFDNFCYILSEVKFPTNSHTTFATNSQQKSEVKAFPTYSTDLRV